MLCSLTLGTEPLLDTRFGAIVCLLTVTLFICSTGGRVIYYISLVHHVTDQEIKNFKHINKKNVNLLLYSQN